MFNPIATYRIQFHQQFTFKNLMQIIPYLHELGVTTIYASPIFEATPGSNHGYDVTNPHRINPEIGTLEEFQEISSRLKTLKINWVQDIVPNHMAFHPNNTWLMEVLENGPDSDYAQFFDINWDAPACKGRLMVPFLGSPLPVIIAGGQLSIVFNAGKFYFSYGEQQYPLNQQSVVHMLSSLSIKPPKELEKLIGKDVINTLRNQLARHFNSGVEAYIREVLDSINENKNLLQQIADKQYYELCYWQDTDHRINYRRFFTVNGLICLNMQNEAVFNQYHRFIKELLEQDLLQGLRVDHVDGLYDPKTYLDNLRALAGDDIYIVIEKILENGENLPSGWPVQGTTGYDFLGMVNNVFTNKKSGTQFSTFYRELTGNTQAVKKAIIQKKADILYKHMAGELENICHIVGSYNLAPGINEGDIKETIAQFLIRCPVYRYYGNSLPLVLEEATALKNIFNEINTEKPQLKKSTDLLSGLLTKPAPVELQPGILKFYQRCMQLSGPLMAKGVEDTLMYTYNRFIGHNEVGDSPEEFGMDTAQFHELMLRRQELWPMAMNGTSTHDTKRGEDVRARLNVLTDMPGDWITAVKKWIEKESITKDGIPDANDAYLIYQTLIGITALPGQQNDQIAERLQAYLTKAMREAKVHTQWAEPNEPYEQGTVQFAKALLADKAFCEELSEWQIKIADPFIVKSLGQLLLKFTCPGIPDIYQGCELWDFSLVDPDNRRPVDYEQRLRLLKKQKNQSLAALWEQRYNGSLKLWLTKCLLNLRRQHAGLFSFGAYKPLQVNGKYKNNLIAFARQQQRNWLITVIPVHLPEMERQSVTLLNWADTHILLPDDAPLKWSSVFTKEQKLFRGAIPLDGLFNTLPLALLKSAEPPAERSAGIIMHVTSLPSPYGIGDLGPEARKFANFLSDAYQRYWQLLPVNPTGQAAAFSPYSAFSSMAGNTLLISPDDLVIDGLLTAEDTAELSLPVMARADYAAALKLKSKLFEQAFSRYEASPDNSLLQEFDTFKQEEQYWLEDFVLYQAAKDLNKGLPWYQWPDELKSRTPKALITLKQERARELEKSRWLQFLFFRQWRALKAYGNQLGIVFFGDMPFYISYDSMDVWTNPGLFDLDENKNIKGIAGVPPDYFNSGGQLWGMPVYNWQQHKATGYAWWIDRIKRNRDFFDVIRLDHFRAFYDFWCVPAGEKNAINGRWLPGPGTDIFQSFKKALGKLPFIAEDLGDVSEGVYQLRDQLKLPGMNLLQYGFGEDMPVSVHCPHNHRNNSVTYTGTHDNNTTLGWFITDSTPVEKEHLSAYLRTKVNNGNINRLMNELCYSSAAAIAMLPMQDVLQLDGSCRMNMPSSSKDNWQWRMVTPADDNIVTGLKNLIIQYNR